MNKKILSITILVLVISFAAFGQGKISISVDEFAQSYNKDASVKWQGIDVELAKAVVEKAGFTPDFKELPWSRALVNLESGSLDILLNATITEERKKTMDFIGPERYSQMGLIVKEENKTLNIKTFDDFKTVANLKKHKFGIQQDVVYSEEFNTKLKDSRFSKDFETVAVAENNIRKLNRNLIIGFFEEKSTLLYLIKNNPDYKGTVLHSFDLFPKDPVYFAVTKKMAKDKFDKLKVAFDALEKDGTLKKIRKKYE